MVEWHALHLPGDLVERHRHHFFAPGSHQDAMDPLVDEAGGRRPKPRCQEAVSR